MQAPGPRAAQVLKLKGIRPSEATELELVQLAQVVRSGACDASSQKVKQLQHEAKGAMAAAGALQQQDLKWQEYLQRRILEVHQSEAERVQKAAVLLFNEPESDQSFLSELSPLAQQVAWEYTQYFAVAQQLVEAQGELSRLQSCIQETTFLVSLWKHEAGSAEQKCKELEKKELERQRAHKQLEQQQLNLKSGWAMQLAQSVDDEELGRRVAAQNPLAILLEELLPTRSRNI